MPILEFDNIESYVEWIKTFAKKDRYMFCITDDNEVIAQPIKTSRPIIYGYIRVGNTELKKITSIIEKQECFISKIKTFSFDTERPPGTRGVGK